MVVCDQNVVHIASVCVYGELLAIKFDRCHTKSYQRDNGVRIPPKRDILIILATVKKLDITGSFLNETGKLRTSRLVNVAEYTRLYKHIVRCLVTETNMGL